MGRVCLRLLKPEPHVHFAVQGGGCHKMLPSLTTIAGRYVEPTNTKVTVGGERAHAQFVAKGHGPSVGGFSSFDVSGLAVRIDLGQPPESPCLLRRLIVVTSEIEGLSGAPDRVVHSVGQPVGLA